MNKLCEKVDVKPRKVNDFCNLNARLANCLTEYKPSKLTILE